MDARARWLLDRWLDPPDDPPERSRALALDHEEMTMPPTRTAAAMLRKCSIETLERLAALAATRGEDLIPYRNELARRSLAPLYDIGRGMLSDTPPHPGAEPVVFDAFARTVVDDSDDAIDEADARQDAALLGDTDDGEY